MSKSLKMIRRSAILAAAVALLIVATHGIGSASAQTTTTTPCYPPSSSCVTTTTVAPTTTTIASTTTTVASTTTTTSGNDNGNGNGNGGDQNVNGRGRLGSNGMAVNNSSPSRGQTIVVTAPPGSFKPGTRGIITISTPNGERQIGTFVVNPDGSVTETITIPGDIDPGAHTLFMRGTGPDGNALVLSRQITVVGGVSSVKARGSLPRTGALVIPAVIIGLALLAVGTVLKRGGQRRRAATER